jgi:hypothetical protein
MRRIVDLAPGGRRLASLAVVAALPGLLVAAGASTGATVTSQVTAAAKPAFTKTEKLTRTNLIDGKNQVVDSRTFSVSVDQTTNLRNRQNVQVSWTGAHPTGGIVPQSTSPFAPGQEYPVVLMMCRGSASATSGKNMITPDTCWTETAGERVQLSTSGAADAFPPYRLDEYASAADRAQNVGVPSPLPAACAAFTQQAAAQHWVPFIAADGTVYPFGPGNPPCAAVPPEATNASSSTEPSNTTYGVTALSGDGSSRFVISTAETNASLGCSDTVACSLVVIPIMGTSCDPAAASLPPADQPPSTVQAAALAQCSSTGDPDFPPGSVDNQGAALTAAQQAQILPVSGYLWWSASNWRNRIMVPLTFAPPSNVCTLQNSSAPVQIFGSYLLLGATQQWAPHFCLNKKLFPLTHVISGEPEAQSLLEGRTINAAFQAAPPQSPFTGKVVQAPTAVTGFAIVFDIVTQQGQEITSLRLDARLLAKLLTESYASQTAMDDDPALQNPTTHQPNPLNIGRDPEFQALNPGIPSGIADLAGVSAATLLAQSGGTDTMWALTSYINADPEARAWLNGQPDPWGMVVNSNYKGIQLPLTQWPLLDTFIPAAVVANNVCFQQQPAPSGMPPPPPPPPWLSQVASPVSSMANITLDLQFDISDSAVNCNDGTPPSLLAQGQQSPGQTFILGVTSLADADQYGLPVASLETQGGSTSNTQFTTSAGRSFAAPSDASLRAAVTMMTPDATAGSWTVPYAKMRTSAAGKSAYPGTMLISTDVPTSGVPASLANDYGEFLSFVANAGQHPGSGNGDIPAGYLPMTAANGAAKMVDYTKLAAADVTAQNGRVPTPGQGLPPGASHQSGTTPGPETGLSSGTQPSSSASSTGSPAPSSGSSPLTTSPGPVTPKLATTALVRSAVAGDLLPLVLLIALVVATIGFGVWQLRRPTEPK